MFRKRLLPPSSVHYSGMKTVTTRSPSPNVWHPPKKQNDVTFCNTMNPVQLPLRHTSHNYRTQPQSCQQCNIDYDGISPSRHWTQEQTLAACKRVTLDKLEKGGADVGWQPTSNRKAHTRFLLLLVCQRCGNNGIRRYVTAERRRWTQRTVEFLLF
jgi:hypothetical protein